MASMGQEPKPNPSMQKVDEEPRMGVPAFRCLGAVTSNAWDTGTRNQGTKSSDAACLPTGTAERKGHVGQTCICTNALGRKEQVKRTIGDEAGRRSAGG